MTHITDAQVDAALAAHYPDEWPNDPIFHKPATTIGPYANRPWRFQVMDEMRRTLEAALTAPALPADEDCEDQGLFATERCTICRVGFDHHRRPIYPKLERRGKFWCCPRCGSSYGENPHPNCPALTAPPLPTDGVREAREKEITRLATIEECAQLIESGAGMADLIDQEELDEQAKMIRTLASPHEQGEG